MKPLCLPWQKGRGLMSKANSRWLLLAALILLVSLFGLYVGTAALGIVPGDPAEYTFVAHVLGIAHPPGYAFMVLLTKLWQTLVPMGSIAQRSHWLAAAAGALTSVLVFGTVWQIAGPRRPVADQSLAGRLLPPFVAALSVAAAADYWQHSLHINSHIVTVTLNALAIFLLVRWWHTSRDRWLYAFCLVAGLGPTQHPLTAFSFPAYAVFILVVRPDIINVASPGWWRAKRWRVPLLMLGFGLLGLAVWLYYPIRSPMKPPFGPHDMNTVDGFLNVVLARGLRVNLFQFGLAEQGQRLLVFVTLLRQQYSWMVLALAAIGLGWLAMRQRRLFALLGLALVINLAFIINTVQDVMAYLLTPFVLIGAAAGIGANVLVSLTGELAQHWQPAGRRPWIVTASLTIVLLAPPATSLARNLPLISLNDYRAGDEYVAAVFERFAGKGERAVLLNDWEHMTPLWYAQFVEGRLPEPADVTPSLVSTDRPWLARVFEHLPGGPVYLSGYRREIVDAGFRLRPDGIFYQVVEPGETDVPDWIQPLSPSVDQPVRLVGYWLPRRAYRAGDIVSLDLAMRAAVTPTDYIIPYAQLGEIRFSFTTDSHLLTRLWKPEEVIVERFSFALPHDLAAGGYPLRVGLTNLTTGTESGSLSLGELSLSENPQTPRAAVLDDLLANFGQRVGVDRVVVSGGGERRSAVWAEPLVIRPDEKLDITIKWRCLAPIEESYTVFVHLIDGTNQIWDQKDYTPLGGSYPTHLWIPKWLPGQTALDPYTLTVPLEAPSGDYYLEIGLYGMTTRQRIYQYDRVGNIVGDRLVLGLVRVQP
jgi:hypothetical protein